MHLPTGRIDRAWWQTMGGTVGCGLYLRRESEVRSNQKPSDVKDVRFLVQSFYSVYDRPTSLNTAVTIFNSCALQLTMHRSQDTKSIHQSLFTEETRTSVHCLTKGSF